MRLCCRSPTRGGATVFPRATRYHVPDVANVQAQQGGLAGGITNSGISVRGAGAVAQDRRLLQGSSVLSGSDDVPSQCREGAKVLQVAPPPGSAVLFW